MTPPAKPYIQFSINEVFSVVFDPEGRHHPDQVDRYSTFEEARDAALSIIELTLDAGDYDDEGHRNELSAMLRVLESASTFDELAVRPEYDRFLASHPTGVLAVA